MAGLFDDVLGSSYTSRRKGLFDDVLFQEDEKEKPEGAFARAARVFQDPEGGVLPAIGSLVASALPQGGDKRTAGGYAADTAVDVARGVVSLGQGVVGVGNLITFGGLGKVLETAGYSGEQTQQFLSGLYTADRQIAQRNVQEAEGFVDTLKSLAVNPSELFGTIVQAVPQTVGAGAAGGAIVRQLLPQAGKAAAAAGLVGDDATKFISNFVAKRAAVAAGGTEGALTAGGIAESGREAGQDYTTYAPAALAGGALTAAIGAGSARVARRIGLGDIEADIAMRGAGVAPSGAKGGLISRTAKGMLQEGALEEAPQSFQEELFTQVATGQPLDFQKAGSAAATGFAAGAGMGGFNAAISRSRPPEQPPASPAPPSALQDLGTANTELSSAVDSYLRDLGQARTADEAINAAVNAASVPVAPTLPPLPTMDERLAAAAETPGLLGRQLDIQRQLDQAAGLDVAPTAERPALPTLPPLPQPAAQRNMELMGQAAQAGTEFERQQALEQAKVSLPTPAPGPAARYVDLTPMDARQAQQRLTVLQEQTGTPLSLEIVPHPAQKERFAIGRRELPVSAADLEMPDLRAPVAPAQAQVQIESAALAGKEVQRRAEDAPRQQMISRAMANIEARGGVASPYEAELLRSANLGQPYNSIDPNLGRSASQDQLLTAATGIPVGSEAGLGYGARTDNALTDIAQRTAQERGELVQQNPQAAGQNIFSRVSDQDVQQRIPLERNRTPDDVSTGFAYTPELQGRKRAEPAEQAAPEVDIVGTFVQQMRETNTPAARAFVQDYEAGRISPTEVQSALDIQRGLPPSSQERIEGAAAAAPAPTTPTGVQVETPSARVENPALREAVELYGNRPLTQQDLTVEGATARIARAGQQAPAPQVTASGIEIAQSEDLTPRGAFRGRNEAIRAGNNLPRPTMVGGRRAALLTDADLQQTANDISLPAITRRGAQIELLARQQTERAAAPAQPAADDVSARLQAAAAQATKPLDQPAPGRIITSGVKMSTARAAVPGSTLTVNDQGTDHQLRVVDSSTLGEPGKMIQQVARIFGKKVVVFESDTAQVDGFVQDNDDSTIYLSAKSSISPLAVFGHELTHLIKRDSPEAYSALEAVVKANLKPEGMAGFEQDYGQGANLEELSSDLVGNRFQEADFWNGVFEDIAAKNPEQSRGIITRLAASVNKAVNAFMRVVRGQTFNADQYVKDLTAVKAAVRTAVSQYAQQRREPAMRLDAELMRQESQVDLTAGSRMPASASAAGETAEPMGITASATRAAPDSAAAENRMAIVVGAKPGEFNWNFTRSDLTPPPFTAPTQYGPRLEKVGEGVYEILRSNGFKKLAEEAFGIKGLRVAPLHGSWLNKPEPSFALYAEGLTFEQADDLSKMLGFAFAQDATVVFQPTSQESPGEIPAVYIGGKKKLTDEQMKAVLSSAQAEGIDYSSTADGKAVRFLHFGDDAGLAELMQKTARIASNAGLGAPRVVYVRSQLNEADSYTKGTGGSAGQAVWLGSGEAGRPGLFRRTVDHVLVPYAKVVGGEGYRFAVSRFAQRFGLSAEQQGLIRQALLPKSGADKATIDVASGKVKLDIKPTGARNKISVSDILWALQNRSAQAGLIEPGDYSDQARKLIAEAIAEEVLHNINDTSTGKSAIGWYDRALKAAKEKYAAIFPELKTDRNRELVFDAVLGITSQGNDVFSNSLFAGRVYEMTTRQNMTLGQAVAALKGTFGGETVAIENNILKLEELINRNGYDAMRKFFNKKDTVSNINAKLRADSTLFYKNKPLSVDGAADQRVTGWMVFGPKIGSFINNLHGDYSTLTADLWFSRTWNRILGFSFVHAPAREAEQYQTFVSALLAEYGFAKDREGPIQPKRISKTGEAEMPEFGTDAADLTDAEVEQIVADPDAALNYATELEAIYRKGGYKAKTDLRRAAKNWIENRTDPVALPRTDWERDFQQRTVETAQKIIKRRTGQEITIADIQAALWYYEKDNLFKLLGGTNKKSEAADYAGAADETLRAYQAGDLFYAKTDDRYVFGSKGSYRVQASRSRERAATDIPLAELRGRKVAMQVRVESTGETGTLTMDAGDSLTDINERETAMQRLLECVRK